MLRKGKSIGRVVPSTRPRSSTLLTLVSPTGGTTPVPEWRSVDPVVPDRDRFSGPPRVQDDHRPTSLHSLQREEERGKGRKVSINDPWVTYGPCPGRRSTGLPLLHQQETGTSRFRSLPPSKMGSPGYITKHHRPTRTCIRRTGPTRRQRSRHLI